MMNIETHAATIALKDAKILSHTSSSGSIEIITANTLNTVPAIPVPCEVMPVSGFIVFELLFMYYGPTIT